MSKQVKRQEGDLEKPLAGQKRDLGKRFAGQKRDLGKGLALNEGENVKRVALGGAGEMVAGRMATRSVKRDLSNVNGEEGDLGKTITRQKRDLGKRFALNEGESVKRVALEKKLQGAGKMVAGCRATGSKGTLYNMFLKWAKKYERKYDSEEELEKRFRVWLSTKEYMDEQHSHRRGYEFSLDYMNLLADMLPAELAKMCGASYEEVPFKGRETLLELSKTKEGLEEVKKTRMEFNKWAKRHRRNYGSKKERSERFLAYLENKKKIDLSFELNPGYWIYGYDLENMDKFPREASLIPGSLHPCEDGWY